MNTPQRFSFVPLVAAVVLTVLCSLLLLRPGQQPGEHGPDIFPGLYAGDDRYITDMPGLQQQVGIEAWSAADGAVLPSIAAPAAALHGGEQLPLLPIGLVAEDGHALSRSAIKALAERLAGITDKAPRGSKDARPVVQIIDPSKPALPIPMLRVLRLATVNASMPSTPGAACQARLAVIIDDARPLALLPLASLQAAGAARAQRFAVSYSSQAQAGAAPSAWGPWHAAVGRAIADQIIAELKRAEGPALRDASSDDATLLHGVAGAGGDPMLGSWAGMVADPPRHEVLRWYAAFQDPLLRGWCGAIIGTTGTTAMGREKPTIDIWSKQLVGGGWQASEPTADGLRVWRRSRTDAATSQPGLDTIVALPTANGWQLAAWQVADHPERLMQTWLDKARSGSAVATALLRRHVAAGGLPAALRAEAQAWLATQADQQPLLKALDLPVAPAAP